VKRLILSPSIYQTSINDCTSHRSPSISAYPLRCNKTQTSDVGCTSPSRSFSVLLPLRILTCQRPTLANLQRIKSISSKNGTNALTSASLSLGGPMQERRQFWRRFATSCRAPNRSYTTTRERRLKLLSFPNSSPALNHICPRRRR
jgi:hypothetical protein